MKTYDKKQNGIGETNVFYQSDRSSTSPVGVRRASPMGPSKIIEAGADGKRFTGLPQSARSVALIDALMVLAAMFISAPAGYAQGYTLAEALNATNLVWTADSIDDTSWFVQTAITHDGVAAVECLPRVGASGAKLHTRVTGPGELTFWCRFGTPLATDLEIVLQKEGLAAQHGLLGGGNDWNQGGVTIGEGVYDVQFGCVVKSTPEPLVLDQIHFTPSVHMPAQGLVIVNGQAQVKFSAPANLAASFKLLKAARLSGPWTTNTTAVLSTNGDSFILSAPIDGSGAQFYRVQCSAGP